MGGVSLPNTTRYREEYLVDTETNEIIYPKVLPSSITIPPSSDGGSDLPSLSVLGEAHAIYRHNPISGDYHMGCLTQMTGDVGIILPAGAWLLIGKIYVVRMRNIANDCDATLSFTLKSEDKYTKLTKSTFTKIIYNPATQEFTHTGVLFLEEQSNIFCIVSNTGTYGNVTLNDGSYVEYTAIKLAIQ